jgi:peptidoglycan-N-acetylglucosamine deacetylase
MVEPLVTPLRTAGRAPRVLTIDVEEWFHVCGDDYYSDPQRWSRFASRIERTFASLLDLLGQGRHRATFFFLGWIARRYPDLVREAARRGHEIGLHGDLHRRVDELTPAEFREDLGRARDAIEKAAAVRPTAHRAAEWSIRYAGDPALLVLVSEGFLCDSSITRVSPLGRAENLPGPHRIQLDGRSLYEIPPLTGRGFGRAIPFGGGWPFRMFSVRRLARAENAFRNSGWPAVFNFHPWEFDPDHPPMEGLSPLARLIHFYNLSATNERFQRWLAADRCMALEDVLPALQA